MSDIIKLLPYVIFALLYFTIFDYRRDEAGRIKLGLPNLLVSLKAAAALVPIFLAQHPEKAKALIPIGPLMLGSTALTVLAAPLAIPFISVPEKYETRAILFFPAWATIAVIRIGVSFVFERTIRILESHFETIDHILRSANDIFFHSYPMLEPGNGRPIPDELQTLLLVGLVARIFLIFGSKRYVPAGLAGSFIGPMTLSYMSQIYSRTDIPADAYEFAAVSGIGLGLVFVCLTEYTMILQARGLTTGRE